MVLGLVLAGADGVLIFGLSDMRPEVAVVLMCMGGVSWRLQGELLLHGNKEGTHFA